jgi:hypothetical protein
MTDRRIGVIVLAVVLMSEIEEITCDTVRRNGAVRSGAAEIHQYLTRLTAAPR